MYNRLDLMELKALYENMIAPILSIILFIVKFLMYIIGIIYISKIQPVYISEVSSDYNNKYYYYVIIVIFILVVYGLIKILGYFKPGLFSMRGFVFPSASKGFDYLVMLLFKGLYLKFSRRLVWFLGEDTFRQGCFSLFKFCVFFILPFLSLFFFYLFIFNKVSSMFIVSFLPLSFIAWLIRLYLVSFEEYIVLNLDEMKEIVNVYGRDAKVLSNGSVSIGAIVLELTDEGIKRGYSHSFCIPLGNLWLAYSSNHLRARSFSERWRLIPGLLILCRVILWGLIATGKYII